MIVTILYVIVTILYVIVSILPYYLYSAICYWCVGVAGMTTCLASKQSTTGSHPGSFSNGAPPPVQCTPPPDFLLVFMLSHTNPGIQTTGWVLFNTSDIDTFSSLSINCGKRLVVTKTCRNFYKVGLVERSTKLLLSLPLLFLSP